MRARALLAFLPFGCVLDVRLKEAARDPAYARAAMPERKRQLPFGRVPLAMRGLLAFVGVAPSSPLAGVDLDEAT